MGAVVVYQGGRLPVTVPAARTRGPAAQLRALGFRLYYTQGPEGNGVTVSRGDKSYLSMFLDISAAAAFLVDVYALSVSFDGGQP